MADLSLLDQAIQQYPYLADKGLSYTRSPDAVGSGRLLEYWKPGVMGWDWRGRRYDRPQGLPADAHGVEVFSDQVRPIDILGDYVSHHGVNQDPRLKDLYSQFIEATPTKAMRDRYDYHRNILGDKRDYMEWVQMTGLPELFRGHLFNQWGAGSEKFYNPQQLSVIQEVQKYLGIR